MSRTQLDDGFFPELFEKFEIEEFEGYDEYPVIKNEEKIIIPNELIPYSKMNVSNVKNGFIHFYEFDIKFLGVRRLVNQKMDIFNKLKE